MSREKQIVWIGSSKEYLKTFPVQVQKVIGYGLHLAQYGERHPDTKIMKGFGGGAVIEIVDNHVGDTYRAVYTTRFGDKVCELHTFQKKSKKGIRTPKPGIEMVKARFKRARELFG